ncbi:hypothetical protein WKW79_28935 [Variovorax robiniae]|uniref:Uncharacterized protein n=1 Tax=Variovorax robiniae TaxID=1836199 RepID=A0ABU8XFI5_9BURK
MKAVIALLLSLLACTMAQAQAQSLIAGKTIYMVNPKGIGAVYDGSTGAKIADLRNAKPLYLEAMDGQKSDDPKPSPSPSPSPSPKPDDPKTWPVFPGCEKGCPKPPDPKPICTGPFCPYKRGDDALILTPNIDRMPSRLRIDQAQKSR